MRKRDCSAGNECDPVIGKADEFGFIMTNLMDSPV